MLYEGAFTVLPQFGETIKHITVQEMGDPVDFYKYSNLGAKEKNRFMRRHAFWLLAPLAALACLSAGILGIILIPLYIFWVIKLRRFIKKWVANGYKRARLYMYMLPISLLTFLRGVCGQPVYLLVI
jgi:hypothetical protein